MCTFQRTSFAKWGSSTCFIFKKKKKKQFEFILIALRAPDVRPLTSNKAEVSISELFSTLVTPYLLLSILLRLFPKGNFIRSKREEGKMLVGSVHKRNVGQTNFHLLQHTQDGTDLYGRAKIIIIKEKGVEREMMFWRLWMMERRHEAAQMSAPTEKSISRSTNWSYRAICIHPCVCILIVFGVLSVEIWKRDLGEFVHKHTPHLKGPSFFIRWRTLGTVSASQISFLMDADRGATGANC